VLTDSAEAELAARYIEGASLNDLASEFGCSYFVVRKALIRQKVPRRSAGRAYRTFTAEELDEIVRRYEAGESQASIARALQTTQTGISRTLRMQGIEPHANHVVGAKHGKWKGGRLVTNEGYVIVLAQPNHPFAAMRNNQGYISEHRLVMAQALGRVLERHETVHHINGDRKDNRLENLELRNGKHGKGVVFVCRDCGSHNIEAAHLASVSGED
jgi:hypothetical protein